MPAVAARKVLIVDDDAHFRGLLARRLSQRGLEVIERPDGAEGLEAMHGNIFDCILLDLKMPKKDGINVLQERVATRNKETPVFVLTSMSSDLATERAKELGADRVLSKSETSPTEVVEMVVDQALAR